MPPGAAYAGRLNRLQRATLAYAVVLLVLIAALIATGTVPLAPVSQPTAAPRRAVATSISSTPVPTTARAAAFAPSAPPRTTPAVIPTAPPPAIATATAPASFTPAARPTLSSLPTPPVIARTQTSAAFAQGNGTGVSLGPDGALSLSPTVSDDFDAAVDAAQWQIVPWGGGGTAAVDQGAVTVTIAAIHTRRVFVHRILEARARFTIGAPFQNLAWSADLNGATAILIGTPASDPDHLYARTKQAGQEDQLTPLPVALADGAFHVYRIAWEAEQVEFAVDGVVRATLPVALDAPMYAWISAASATPLTVDWVRVLDYGQVEGTFMGPTLDGGAGARWTHLTVSGTIPAGSAVLVRTQTSADGVMWSDDTPLGADGTVASPMGRYLRYVLTLNGDGATSPTVMAVTAIVVPGDGTR